MHRARHTQAVHMSEHAKAPAVHRARAARGSRCASQTADCSAWPAGSHAGVVDIWDLSMLANGRQSAEQPDMDSAPDWLMASALHTSKRVWRQPRLTAKVFSVRLADDWRVRLQRRRTRLLESGPYVFRSCWEHPFLARVL